jgi:hypothetical protein
MADCVVKFIQVANRVHDIDITYTGVWNEMPWNKEWVKLLRRTLDSNGLKYVINVAADQYDGSKWEVAKIVSEDPEFDRALGVVGVHYPQGSSPEFAQISGKRLWSSEDGSKPGDWRSAMHIARLYNRNYVGGRMIETLVWSPIASFYDNLPYARTGHMLANEPWSGHYVVEPAIWITSHTTQFANPGWKYIDNACRMIDGGSVVVMKSPDGKDLSVMVETIDASLNFRSAMRAKPATPQLLERVIRFHPVVGMTKRKAPDKTLSGRVKKPTRSKLIAIPSPTQSHKIRENHQALVPRLRRVPARPIATLRPSHVGRRWHTRSPRPVERQPQLDGHRSRR